MIRISQRPFRGAFFAPASGKRPWAPPGHAAAVFQSPRSESEPPRGLGRGSMEFAHTRRAGAHVPAPGAGTLRGPQTPQPCRRHGCAPAAPYTARLPFCPGPASRPPPQNGGHPFLRHAGALPAYLSRFTQIADKSIPVVCSAYPWCPVAFPGGGFTRGRGSAQRFSRR